MGKINVIDKILIKKRGKTEKMGLEETIERIPI